MLAMLKFGEKGFVSLKYLVKKDQTFFLHLFYYKIVSPYDNLDLSSYGQRRSLFSYHITT